MNMSKYVEIIQSRSTPPKGAVIILAFVFIFGLFTMAFDQGHTFSIIQGADAFDSMYLHELSHDLRHAAGFPCH